MLVYRRNGDGIFRSFSVIRCKIAHIRSSRPEIKSVERRYVRRVRRVVKRRTELEIIVSLSFFRKRCVRVRSSVGIDVVYQISHLRRFAPAVR